MRPVRISAVCLIPGCGKPYRARGYCAGCYQQVWNKGRTNGGVRIELARRSECCGAEVTVGRKHDAGRMYCTACSNPCFWRNVPIEVSTKAA